MKNLLVAKNLANAWSQWCCRGLLLTAAAYLFVMFLVLPLFSFW
jgi:hypothetical protein